MLPNKVFDVVCQADFCRQCFSTFKMINMLLTRHVGDAEAIFALSCVQKVKRVVLELV